MPASSDRLDRMVTALDAGPLDVQPVGDHIGRGHATYTNDLSMPGQFTLSGRIAADVPFPRGLFATMVLNVTNVTAERAASTLSVGIASGRHDFLPVAPRQFFGTINMGVQG